MLIPVGNGTSGYWYFFNQENAWMSTGWTTNRDNNELYYLDAAGHPVTGWQMSQDGTWYYFQSGSYAAATDWQWLNGHWYYFNPGYPKHGAMMTGWQNINGKSYYFYSNGYWSGY